MPTFRFGPIVTDRGYDDWLGALAREVALGRAYDDFGRFARNPVQPRDPRITPISGATPPLVPVPAPVPVPGLPGVPPPPSVPGFPGGAGGSIPDRIPGRPAVGSIAGFLTSILRGGWIGALFYPSANPGGAGSALCIETEYGPWCPPGLPDFAVPAPVAVPGQRGRRRPRAVPAAPGRRRRRAGVAVPGAVPIGPPRPRGRPVTLTRPRVETRPDVAAVARSPASSPQPPPVPQSIPQAQPVSLPSTPTIAAPAPAVVPAARSLPLPAIAGLVLSVLGAWIGSPALAPPRIAAPSIAPGLGTVPLPTIGPAPAPLPVPAPLTLPQSAPAISPAQSLDQQCRARARQRRKKRKPRSECYRGTYVEKRNGTIKRRKEKIKCQ